MEGYKVRDLTRNPDVGWIKIYHKKYSNVRSDMFIVYMDKKKGYYRTYWTSELARDVWPKCWIKKEELFPLKLYKFGATHILGPKNPGPTLTRCYGKSWNTKGYITQDKDHMDLDEPVRVNTTNFAAAKNFYRPGENKKMSVNEGILKGSLISFKIFSLIK